ncbi:hypothetical protein FAUST_5609 [Fusarium austroamericanum]|uniref:DUF7730 domain-containing protein n=1 Tax=Fusarium austroamericanum TaxID=282268 RepID=A0AAN6C182_FUSAU|nr:hypothetical protein FAUST_5609 [Fusarium austroamericanum]
MDFINRLLGRNTDTKYRYRGAKLPKEPLTPRKIEEMHLKLHPDTHIFNAAQAKQQDSDLDNRDWNISRTSLEEQFSSAAADGSLQKAQSESLLFSRLPLEVRILRQSAFESNNYHWMPHRGLLGVPLVCRAAYIESISSLYSANTFCFGFGQASSKSALVSLSTMLPKQHIAFIQHIEVGWHLYAGVSQYYDSHPQAWDISMDVPAPETETLWNNVCTELVEMSYLRTLRIVVWLSGDGRARFIEKETDMLAPLVTMRHLQRFDVHLPWKQDDTELWKDAPFRVSRGFRVKEMYGVSIPLLDVDFYWSGSVAQQRVYRKGLQAEEDTPQA